MATFGYTGAQDDSGTLENYIYGGFYAPSASGTVSSISAYLVIADGWSEEVKYAIYEYVDHSSDYAGALIKSTEEISPTVTGWHAADILTPAPSVVASTNYYLFAWAGAGTGSCRLAVNSGGAALARKSVDYGAWENPLTGENGLSYDVLIECTYTEGGEAHTHTPSDTMTLSDTISPVASYNRSISDTLSMSDTPATIGTYLRTITDTLSISDSLLLGYVIVLSDSFTVSDAVSTIGVYARAITDTLSVTDSPSTVGTYLRSLSDSLNISDSPSVAAVYLRSLSDTLSISDSVVAGYVIALSDTLSISDVNAVVGNYIRALSDTLSISDLFASDYVVPIPIMRYNGKTIALILQGYVSDAEKKGKILDNNYIGLIKKKNYKGYVKNESY